METAPTGSPEPDERIFEEPMDDDREPTFLEWFAALAEVDDRARESLEREIYPDPQLMSVAMDMPAPRASGPTKPKG